LQARKFYARKRENDDHKQNSLTVGPRGPVVFEDFLLFEKMAHFNRERIPERVVHAKGSGAHGHLVNCSTFTRPIQLTEQEWPRVWGLISPRSPRWRKSWFQPIEHRLDTKRASLFGLPSVLLRSAIEKAFLCGTVLEGNRDAQPDQTVFL